MLLPVVTKAYDAYINGIYYNFKGDEATVTYKLYSNGIYYSYYSGSVIIPESVTYNGTTYTVTSIGGYAFSACTGLTSNTIPNSVTSIGYYAFNKCIGLTSITIPNSVTSIGSYAFYGCTGLTSITIPNSVTSIGSHTFLVCTGLTSITIPNSVTSIGDAAFRGCTSLTSITIPNSVTSIGDAAFWGCSGLTIVTIGNGVTSIGDEAFSGCGLTSITIPSSVTSIGQAAFPDNKLKKTIWLTNTPPSGYTNAMGAINYVSNEQYTPLQNKVVYPFLSSMFEVEGIKYVPVNPSERICDAIDCVYDETVTNLNIPSTVSYLGITMSVQKIQPYLCYKNEFIKTLSCENSGNIAEYAFYGCTGIVSADCSNTRNIAEYAFSGCMNMTSLLLGENVSAIGNYAFQNCSSLQSVNIPDATVSFGGYAFEKCSQMTSARIGTGIKAIPTYAFSNCSCLTDIQLGQNVQSIDKYAFSGCSALPTITLPKSVNTIGDCAFQGCTALKDFIIENRENELSIGSNGSSPLFTDCPLDSVYIGGNITYNTSTTKGYSPFYRNTTLRAVEISDNETEISDNEFYGCVNLKNVRIGNGVTTIGNWAFSGCSSLDFFYSGQKVKNIGKEAFSDCTALTHLESRAGTPPTCGSQALDDINKWTCKLIVPQGYLEAYQSADQWKEFFFIEEGEPIPVPITGLSLNKKNTSFYMSESDTLSVSYIPENTTDKEIEWSSSDESIATVDNNGVVTGKKGGVATITARSVSNPDIFASCTVTVRWPSIALNKTSTSIIVEESDTLTVIFTPENIADKDIVWSSSDETIAVVDKNGVVTGKAKGTVTITARYVLNPEITASCIITVLPPNIIFADALVKKLCVERWDTNKDGELNEDEAASVINLGRIFSFSQIQSFDELKYFTGLAEISKEAFYSCRNLREISIPDGVKSIGDAVFASCVTLSSIHIGKSVASFGINVFTSCDSLKSISIESENTIYDSRDNCNAIIETSTNTLIKGCMNSTVPNGVIIIDDKAFNDCKGLKTIDIPGSVTTIGNAFRGCIDLTTITLAEGVVNIGTRAFMNCSSLTSIVIPEGVTGISSLAFDGCTSLGSITFPSTLTLIDWEYWDSSIPTGFAYCNNLKEIHIKDLSAWCKIRFKTNPLSKAHHLFLNGEEVTDLIIPDDVSSISASAFAYCYGLNSVVIPEGVKSIGSSAFAGCDNLRVITIKSSLTEIEGYAFNSNSQKMVYYPDLSTWCKSSFGSSFNNYRLFINGTEIKELIIPEDVIEIGKNAFAGYTGLTSVKFSNSVKTISDYAFRNCTQLTSVTFSESITDIGVGAFQGCSNLYSIALPDGMVSLANEVFRDCSNLTSVILSDSLTNIGAMAFYNCYRLYSLTLSKALESIGQNAFYRCSQLSSITIPKSLTNISSDIFSGCSSLASIKVEEGNPVYDSRGDCNAIIETETNTLILGCKNTTIPKNIFHIGYGAFYLCSGLSTITIPDGVQSIDDVAFRECSGLTSIIIPNSVKSIGRFAFAYCYSASITIPDSVAFVGENAFDGTAWLNNQSDGLVYAGLVAYKYKGTLPENASIDIKEGTTCIGGGLFGNHKNLTSINIPKSVTYIGDGAFYDCIGLTSVNLPENVTYIGNSAFAYCSNLTSINLPDEISIIGNSAFSNCTNLTAIIIPKGLSFIEQNTFSRCSNLESIILPQNIDSIAWHAFWGCYNLKSITSLNPTPPIVEDGNEFPYTTATLYVPTGSKEAYQAANFWKDFMNIVEIDDPDGISSSTMDELENTSIYDLNGRKLDKPQRGINIIRMSDGTSRKVLIK